MGLQKILSDTRTPQQKLIDDYNAKEQARKAQEALSRPAFVQKNFDKAEDQARREKSARAEKIRLQDKAEKAKKEKQANETVAVPINTNVPGIGKNGTVVMDVKGWKNKTTEEKQAFLDKARKDVIDNEVELAKQKAPEQISGPTKNGKPMQVPQLTGQGAVNPYDGGPEPGLGTKLMAGTATAGDVAQGAMGAVNKTAPYVGGAIPMLGGTGVLQPVSNALNSMSKVAQKAEDKIFGTPGKAGDAGDLLNEYGLHGISAFTHTLSTMMDKNATPVERNLAAGQAALAILPMGKGASAFLKVAAEDGLGMALKSIPKAAAAKITKGLEEGIGRHALNDLLSGGKNEVGLGAKIPEFPPVPGGTNRQQLQGAISALSNGQVKNQVSKESLDTLQRIINSKLDEKMTKEVKAGAHNYEADYMKANESEVHSPKQKSPPSNSGSNYQSTGRTSAVPKPAKQLHPDIEYPNWRKQTQGVMNAIDKRIAEGVGSNKKKGLLNLKSELRKSLVKGEPHPGIVDEYKNAERGNPLEQPKPEEPKQAPTSMNPNRRAGMAYTEKQTPTAPERTPYEAPKPKYNPEDAVKRPEPKPKLENKPPVKKPPVQNAEIKAPPVQDHTSARHADVEVDRASLGIPEVEKSTKKTFGESYDKAKERGYTKPEWAIAEATKINKKPRALNDEETAGMVHNMTSLKAQHAEILKDISKTDDPQMLSNLKHQLDKTQTDFDNISSAVKKSGSEKGRALNSQKFTLDNSYDVISVKSKMKAAKGAPLTEKESQQAEEYSKGFVSQEEHSKAMQELKDHFQKQIDELKDGSSLPKSGGAKAKGTGKAREVFKNEIEEAKKGLASAKERFAKEGQSSRGRQGGAAPILIPLAKLTTEETKYVAKVVKAHAKLGWQTSKEFVAATKKVLNDDLGIDASDAEILKLHTQAAKVVPQELKDALSAQQKLLADSRKELGNITGETAKRKAQIEINARARRLANIQKSVDEMEQAYKEGRVPDSTLKRRAKMEATKARDEADRELQRSLLQKTQWQDKIRQMESRLNATPVDKAVKTWTNFQRTAVLSSPMVFAKLAAATAGHAIVTPFEELLGPVVGKLTGLGKYAGTEAHFSPKAEFAAMKEFFSPATYKDAAKKLKTGYNSLDLEAIHNGVKTERVEKINALLFYEQNSHGAMKTPLQRSAYAREFVKQLEQSKRLGRNPLSADVRMDASIQAYAKSREAILMNDSHAKELLNQFINAPARKSEGGKIVTGLARTAMPITGVPLNFAGRSGEYVGGLGYGVVKQLIHGKSMTPEVAESIMRAYKRGGVGAGLVGVGAYIAANNNVKVDKYGHMTINGKELPPAFTHSPALEAIKMGIAWHNAGFTKGVYGTGRDIAFGTPGVHVAQDFSRGLENEKSAGRVFSKTAESAMVPQVVQLLAKSTDPVKNRKARNWVDDLKFGIPGLRESDLSKLRIPPLGK